MRIEFVSTFLPDVVIESVTWDGTLASYLDDQTPAWRYYAVQPITVRNDVQDVPIERWGDEFETLRVFVHVRGGLFKSLGSILGSIFNIAFGWLSPSQKGINQSSPEQGKALEAPQGAANVAKLTQVVPEIAGRYKRSPDYLTLPRRNYANYREQWLEFHCCIGPGAYDINDFDVKVGDTPLLSLGNDAQFKIFGPGESLAGVPTKDAWHTVPEVGGTSSGTAGLELTSEFGNRENVDPASYSFNGSTITRPDGDFPSAWGNGTAVNVEYPKPYAVATIIYPETETEPGYSISQITGYFGHVSVEVGDIVGIGPIDNAVSYRVRTSIVVNPSAKTIELETVAGGSPVVLPAGAIRYLIFGANINRTISQFSEDQIEVSPSGFESGSVAGARIRLASGGIVYGEWTSEFMASPGQETSGVIEYDIFFPEGLGFINSSGDVINRGVGIEFQYRNAAGGPRVTVSNYYENATLDQIGITEQIYTTNERWMCRMRRIGAESTDTQIKDKVQWYGLKSLLAVKESYPDWTTMMVRLRSGGKISAQSENQINVIATRRLPELLGPNNWTSPLPTRAISAFVRYIALSIGYTDADIDQEALTNLHNIWHPRGDNFDYVFDETTVKAALDLVLAAGMGELTVANGQLRPIREGVRTTFEQAYSSANMRGPLRSTFRQRKPGDPDGVEVEYTDINTWTKRYVRCFLPGDAGFKIQKIKAEGVVSRDQAWRIGMRMRRDQRYNNWGYSFTTELSGLNSDYKSYVPLFDDMPGYGNSARMLSITPAPGGARIVMDAEFPLTEGVPYVVGYRRRDGVMLGPFPASRGDYPDEIIANIPQPWPSTSMDADLPHVYIGETERFCFPALITDISPGDNNEVSVSAVKYDERKYADDNNFPPD